MKSLMQADKDLHNIGCGIEYKHSNCVQIVKKDGDVVAETEINDINDDVVVVKFIEDFIMAKTNAQHQSTWKGKKCEAGLKRKEYWATTVHHEILTKCLKKLQAS